MNVPELRLSNHLSAIFDEERGECIILDERLGRYWHLSGATLQVLIVLNQSKSVTLEYISKSLGVSTEDVAAILGSLLESKLIREAAPANDFPHRYQSKRDRFRPVTEFILQEQHAYPNLLMVIEYAVLIPYWKLRLLLTGWRSIRHILLHHQDSYSNDLDVPPKPLYESEKILSAVRIACVFPWMRRTCIPNSLAIYGMLKRRGFLPILVIGADIVPFEPHMWTELAGFRIDSGADEQSLSVFRPLSFVLENIEARMMNHTGSLTQFSI